MAKVVLPQGYSRRSTIEILAKWNNVDVQIEENANEAIPTLTIGEQTVCGIPAIAGLLGRTSKNSKSWAKETLGDGNQLESSLIAQFIDIAEAAANGTSGAPLKSTVGQVSLHLKTRRFLASDNLTAADVIMYCALYKEVSEMTDKEMIALCDVCRWMDHVHALINDPFPALKLQKLAFNHSACAKKEKKQADHKGAAGNAAAPKEQHAKEPKGKKEKKEKKQQEPAKVEEKADPASYLDIRVGQIIKIEPHPDADTLYFEEIDIGGGATRKVVTGVRNFIPIEQMQNRKVVVICNMKPSKLRGLPSEGMVCAGSNDEHTVVELLDAPADTPVGTRVLFGDFCTTPPVACDKKGTLWKEVSPHCRIDENGVATYKGQPLHVPQGNVTVPTLRNTIFK